MMVICGTRDQKSYPSVLKVLNNFLVFLLNFYGFVYFLCKTKQYYNLFSALRKILSFFKIFGLEGLFKFILGEYTLKIIYMVYMCLFCCPFFCFNLMGNRCH